MYIHASRELHARKKINSIVVSSMRGKPVVLASERLLYFFVIVTWLEFLVLSMVMDLIMSWVAVSSVGGINLTSEEFLWCSRR